MKPAFATGSEYVKWVEENEQLHKDLMAKGGLLKSKMRAADSITASILMALGGIVIFDALRLGIGWGTDGPKADFFRFGWR